MKNVCRISTLVVALCLASGISGCATVDPNSETAICDDFLEVMKEVLQDSSDVNVGYGLANYADSLDKLAARAQGELAAEFSVKAEAIRESLSKGEVDGIDAGNAEEICSAIQKND